ncbi:stAR-related lipid transfer protein 9 isoform X11 [Elephas maximus indicus]|uniref:stAR-related lipid transfer protein 9 isoform X11 n=1 Tax=Elephas maximus indicus TaxID=99487 RepID=UPI002116D911|nr:stAR-related lipid transfer protein 9 isoform X11 [Elephas maximus indicus]
MGLDRVSREAKDGGRIIVEVDGRVATIRNLKVDDRPDGFGDSREKVVTFGFDYCYWSVNPEDPRYASQDVVFQDLGTEVLSGAAKGYNICLFAYGQTGSGKTYTMLGTPASMGLTPRICEGLFSREEDHPSLPSSCRIKVSFLEIYNERVRDLLKQSDQKKPYTLRVREHPEMGPYVQGLSQHVVTNYKQVIQLLEEGIANRITAATHVHEASSRSHAIFTIHYTQAILENNLPSEIASKINLVDLAGSERADPSYCKDRITEGANINKSLVTLGIVISTLAQNSQVFSSCQSLNSAASDGGDSGIPSSSSRTSSGGRPSRKQSYIPYRDSVLTWLLKDSLGGNSKTIMVATVSPAHTSYSETMSTLRYASNAKNIINKPRVNEDANVKLIRELREEIERLKAMLLSFELRNFSSPNDEKDENLKELVLQNELKIDQLTKDWTQKWSDWKALMEYYSVDINRRRAGLVIDSSLPHLMALEDDVLSTSVVLYHLKEGTTKIGRVDSDQEQDIVLQGQWIERDHCTITSACGVVVLRPTPGARCTVNGREVTASCRLTQGAVITLGKARKFRFNHPAEAAVLRRRRQVGEAVGGNGSLEWLDLDGDVTASRMGLYPLLWKERGVLGEQGEEDHPQPGNGATSHGAQIQQQQCYAEDLRQHILAGSIRAEQELELDQAVLNQQIKDNQQWLLREETWLASLQQQQQQDCVAEKELEASVAPDAWLQTDGEAQPPPLVRSQKRAAQLQLLRRHALRTAERNVWRKTATFQLERTIKKQRLLEAQRSLDQLKALCWLQDDSTQQPPDQVPGPRRRSRAAGCSSLSLQRLCSPYSPQLHSVLLSQDPSTPLPPMPGPTHQMSEKIPSEERLPQTASYPPRTRSLNKNDLCSSTQGQLCTARGALAMKEASAPGTCFTMRRESASIQEMERLLHSTSELLGSLSQPSVARKEQNTKEAPGEAPQALRMDSCTQTAVDKGSQTDLASLPLPLQVPEASNAQEANVTLEVLGSDTLTMSPEKGAVPRALEKREAEETAWKTPGSSDLREESIHCRPQRPLVLPSHLRFQKDPLGQKLPSVSPQDSPNVALASSSQQETSACLAVSSSRLSICHSSGLLPNTAEATGEPRVQKKKPGLMSALLVDRASSPILILSASAQGSCPVPGTLSISALSPQPLEGHQKLDISPVPAPVDGYPQPSDEAGDLPGVDAHCGGGRGPWERSDERPFLELSSLSIPQHCPELPDGVLGQPPQQHQPRTTQAVPTWVQRSTRPPLPLRSRSHRLAKSFVPEEVASPDCDPLSSRGPAPWQSRTESGSERPALLVGPQPAPGNSSPWGDTRHLSPCPVSEETDTTVLRDSASGPAGARQPEGLWSPTSQTCMASEPSHHSLRDLPVHNKFTNWCVLCGDSPVGRGVTEELETRCDLGSGEQGERPPHAPEDQSQAPEWPQREQIPLKVGAQNPSLSLELTEAKLHRGFGEADALLRVLQSGTGAALAADHPMLATWEELHARQKKAIQTLRKERAERLQNFRRTPSLSRQKQLSLLPSMDFPKWELNFPSRRRDYLQQLRKDIVETTRSSEAVPRSAHPPSDIELMLRDYQRAREEAKVEIARARERLRERTQQEKLRIQEQIVSQLQREEEKLQTLANSSPLCTSSNASLSSGVTSGYDSNPALSGQLQSPDTLGDTDLSDSRDAWMGDGRGRPAVRSHHLCLAGPSWKNSAYGHGASLGSGCCSPSSLSSSRTCFSSSYQDLAKHIVDISVADVMAACSNNLHNLFIRQAAAGWSYQGEEQEVRLYYKVFSSTRHGFLGAGVVPQPLPQVWAAVSDPTLWPLYHKPIQTAQLHQRVTNSISLGEPREGFLGAWSLVYPAGSGLGTEVAGLEAAPRRAGTHAVSRLLRRGGLAGCQAMSDGVAERVLGWEGSRASICHVPADTRILPHSIPAVQHCPVCPDTAAGFLLCLCGSQRGAPVHHGGSVGI